MTRPSDDGDEIRKLFVGGLSWKTTEENLKAYFSQYGQVIDCIIMKNNLTNKPRGFGFVEFENCDSVTAVVENGPHYLDGKTIDPKMCRPRSENVAKKMKRDNGFQIFLGGLQPYTTEMDIRNAFSVFGSISDVSIIYDKEKRRSKGYGFLTFQSEDSAREVCNQQYVNVNDCQIQCKIAVPQDRSATSFDKNRKFPRRQDMSWISQERSEASNYYGSFPMQTPYDVGYGNNWGTAVQQPYLATPPPPLGISHYCDNKGSTGPGYVSYSSTEVSPQIRESNPSHRNAQIHPAGGFVTCPSVYNSATPVYTTGTISSDAGRQGFPSYYYHRI